jgi:hypothetical protein
MNKEDMHSHKWHEEVVTFILKHPGCRIWDIADYFEINPLAIAMLLDTPSFRDRFGQRFVSTKISHTKKAG